MPTAIRMSALHSWHSKARRKKFRGDLRKLFELDHDGKTKLIKKPNVEIPTILASGRKIKLVRCALILLRPSDTLGNWWFPDEEPLLSCPMPSPI